MSKFTLILCFVAVAISHVYCNSEEKDAAVAASLKSMLVECTKGTGFTPEDLKKESKNNPGDKDPHFKKCFLQKVGILDKDGKYDSKAAHAHIKESADNEDIARKIIETMEKCIKDNEAEIKDDEEKRIDLVYQCLSEYKE